MARHDTDKEHLIKRAWKESGLHSKSALKIKARNLRSGTDKARHEALEKAKSLISKKGQKIEKAKDDAWNKYGEYID